MTDRRPSGFRLWRQPPPSGHFAPEAEAYHHRQNVYFQVQVWIAIGCVAVAVLLLFNMTGTGDNPFTATYRELPLPTAQEKAAQDHDKRDGAMDWRELRAHMAEGPHGVRP